ncbi:LysR family transcriptional regulator [Microbacterium halophytorum]|uniref:LysR family transcriptional regulator n=1 Tax=Microbacterium halophytorum TaxID=2067568 RepID=UPI000CFB8A25|nr:LysR family transcriptional regulator [Microbacterium halophytorum]
MSVDLNLLRTFLAILDAGSVTAAADDLRLTQPTVSHALGRLREQLGDPLFVRHGAGIVPTERAVELGPLVRSALANLDDAVDAHRAFDPATTEREFRIRLSDIGESSFLPAVLRAMAAEAPFASVIVEQTPIDEVVDALARGAIDAAIASVELDVSGRAAVLRGDHYVALMHPDDAPAALRLTAEEVAERAHAVVSKRAGHAQIDAALAAVGVVRRAAVQVQHFLALPQLVADGGLMAVMPVHMADAVAPTWGLAVRELPKGMPEFDVNLYWDAAVTGATGPRAWFIGLARRALAEARNG